MADGDQTKRVRTVRLRVIGGTVELRDDVPKSRAECPTVRPCPHIHCRNHLWMIDGRDRPGRRHPGRRLPSSEIVPVWLEWPLPRSCYADLHESGELHSWSLEKKATIMALSVDSYQWTFRNASRKLRQFAERGVLALSDFVKG